MSPKLGRRSLLALASLGIALTEVRPAAAQSQCFGGGLRPAVYFTTPDNDVSCVLFSTGETRRVINDATGALFKGVHALFEGDGAGVSLVVASSTQGGDIQVYGCNAAGELCSLRGQAAILKDAIGVALDTFGNLAAVSGGEILYARRCTPGGGACDGVSPTSGYDAPTTPVAVSPPSQLLDVRFVSNAVEQLDEESCPTASPQAAPKYQPGDVLVLASDRVGVLDNGQASLKNTIPLAPGFSASGFALFPKTGELLVATTQGTLLVYNRCGERLADFASPGGQLVGVAVGNTNPGGADPASGSEAYVTAKSSNRVLRYVAARQGPNLVGGSPQTVGVTNPPQGVANASLTDSAWTPPGVNSLVNPAVGHDIVFANVGPDGGFSQSRVYLIKESALALTAGTITASMVGLPSTFTGRQVPGTVHCFDHSDGNCYFAVYVADTSVSVFGTTQEHELHEEVLGFKETDCNGVLTPQPRLFRATDQNDPAIVEGSSFADVTTGCNSHIGRGGEFSIFLTGHDERSMLTIANEKLASLKTALTRTDPATGGLSPYIKKATQKTLSRDLDKAIAAFGRSNETSARSYLDSMVATVMGNPGSFWACPNNSPPSCAAPTRRNAPGEIISRAESANFMICQSGGDPVSVCSITLLP